MLVTLRTVQNILRLRDKYSPQRLDSALRFSKPRYGAISQILKKGLDQEQLSPITTESGSTHTNGGRFLRDCTKLFH